MFYSAKNLTTIYVSKLFVVSENTTGSGMFQSCENLVGEMNSRPQWGKYGIAYAHIDGGESNPGYFTAATGMQSLTNSVNINVDSAYGIGVDPAA